MTSHTLQIRDPSDPYILPLVTAGTRLCLLSSILYRRFWTAAPRRVPNILSAASHQPTALCNQVRMYYSSSTHLLISLQNMITKLPSFVKRGDIFSLIPFFLLYRFRQRQFYQDIPSVPPPTTSVRPPLLPSFHRDRDHDRSFPESP